jgi:hypothetical protein
MLDAVTELAQHGLRQVQGILRHEIDSDALRTNEAHNLHDFVLNDFGQIGKKQMGFIEKENQLRFFWVANFRKALEKRSEQP